MPGVPSVAVEQLAAHVWVVNVVGEHDLANAKQLEDSVQRVFDAGSCLLLDLSDATFIDSSVVRVIVSAQARADQNTHDALVVVAPKTSVPRRVLDLVGLADHVTICDDRPNGLATLGVATSTRPRRRQRAFLPPSSERERWLVTEGCTASDRAPLP